MNSNMGLMNAANTGNLFFNYQGAGLISPAANLINPNNMRMISGQNGMQGLFSP